MIIRYKQHKKTKQNSQQTQQKGLRDCHILFPFLNTAVLLTYPHYLFHYGILIHSIMQYISQSTKDSLDMVIV